MAFLWKRSTLCASAIIGTTTLISTERKDTFINYLKHQSNKTAECYIADERRKRVQQMQTNVYVWGEGQQVDI